jgi:hypothetical protein
MACGKKLVLHGFCKNSGVFVKYAADQDFALILSGHQDRMQSAWMSWIDAILRAY